MVGTELKSVMVGKELEGGEEKGVVGWYDRIEEDEDL